MKSRSEASELPMPEEANRRLSLRLGLAALIMFAFGYLLVPFYDQICKAIGLRDLDRPDVVAITHVDKGRTVRLEFDANLSKLPWRFRPETPIVDIHPGELVYVVYEVENTAERPMTGQAILSYGPALAAAYFRKIECFCFTQQSFGPREKRRMPVVLVVDPKLPKEVTAITLSYTFFEVEGNKT
jgi:cytochrome c oxidase assembly protein subunit 11